jgi:hypothetical protein
VQRPAVLLGVGAVLAIVAFQLWITPSNPPGYHRNEAALSYNAYSISTSLRDEDGAFLPLFFRSFGDYKSPLYPYVLAGVLRITGPEAEVARGLSAVLVLAAVLLLGLLAHRRTGSYPVAVIVVVLAGLTPWLFEVGRVALEVSIQPLLLTLLLLALLRSWQRRLSRRPGGAMSPGLRRPCSRPPVAVQFVQFLHEYRTRGPRRTVLFDAGVPALLDRAFANGSTIYIDYDDRGAQAQARWHAAESGLPRGRVQILPDGGIPPKGSTVFGLFQECDYVCTKFARWENYWLAKAIGPRSG